MPWARQKILILFWEGLYNDRIRLRGSFATGVVVKSVRPYMAKFRYDGGPIVVAYENTMGCHGITLEGFDIAHASKEASPLVVHIDGDGTGAVHDITIQNCILHDSYNNDIAKINHGCYNITIQGNLFFNQQGKDEHIDGNSVENLVIQDNIFLNDFESSGRENDNTTSSFIVIKDSGGDNDIYLGSRNVKIRRNVFLNWEGYFGSGFILLGEDGEPYYEAYDVLIENNLMLGNSANNIRSPFGIKGAKDVTFRNNTIVGDLPGNAFAFRFNQEQQNPVNDSIYVYNNIWSDPTGSMNDFSDCPLEHTDYFKIDNNLYWNNNVDIPESGSDEINFSDDSNALEGNPLLGNQNNLTAPHFNSETNQFKDGSNTIREAFKRLVNFYGTPDSNSPIINAANQTNAPLDDILGNLRERSDIGAVEYQDEITNIYNGTTKSNLSIYPNPATEMVSLIYESSFIGELEIALLSLEGKVINTKTIHKSQKSERITWPVSILKKGMYILRVSNGNEVYTEKLSIH